MLVDRREAVDLECAGHHVNAESLRDVHVLMLLLCMRVLWRREVAEVKDFF
jgi:hypothetical protein